MKTLTDFRKTVETGVDPHLHIWQYPPPPGGYKERFGNSYLPILEYRGKLKTVASCSFYPTYS